MTVLTARSVFRKYVTDNVPGSGNNNPDKDEIIPLLESYEAALGGLVTPELFGALGDGTTDDTASLQALITWLNANSTGGAVVNMRPGADYKIWPVGSHPGVAFSLTGIKGLIWNFNGSRISTDNAFGFADGPQVFSLSHCQNVTFNDPEYVATAWAAPLNEADFGVFFNISDPSLPYSSNIRFNNFRQNGGSFAIRVVGDLAGISAQGISVINADIRNVYYGFGFLGSGDHFFARGVRFRNMGRSYFPWNVHNHDVEIESEGGGPFNDCLLKCYAYPAMPDERRQLADIRLVYRNVGRVNATTSESLTTLNFQQTVPQVTVTGAANNGSGKVRLTVNSTADMATGQRWFFNSIGGTTEANGKFVITKIDATHVDLATVSFVHAYTSGGYARVPAVIKNIKIQLDVSDLTGNQQPNAVSTYKHANGGTSDTTTSGYTLENVEISGTLKGYDYGIRAIDMFNDDIGLGSDGSLGTWGGETIRNVALRNLVIEGTNTSVVIDATAAISMMFENIWATPSTVTFTLTDPSSVVKVKNVTVTGVTDVGTLVESEIASGSAVSLVTGTGKNVTSISLPPGDWDVWGSIAFAPNAATTATFFSAGVNNVTNTTPTSPNKGGLSDTREAFTAGNALTLSAGRRRYLLTSTTTIYLVANAVFAVNTMSAYGYLGARRVG